MKPIDWYFDFISPFAYLAEPSLLQTPEMRAIDAMPDGIQRKI